MIKANQFKRSTRPYDVIIVGAGASGLNALHQFRKRGFNTMIIEAGDGVAGTWFWNRYPGLVVDIESVEYSYAFDDALQQEWQWSQRYAPQEELERYFNHVADRFGLREHILLNNLVEHANFDEAAEEWVFRTDKGGEYRAPVAVMATGLVSAPHIAKFDGMESFEGESLHTAYWPREGVDLKGKRVAVIGTGSSGVQVISTIASEVDQLTVFQRTPSFCVPLRNCEMPPDYFDDVRRNYSTWRHRERYHSFAGWVSVNFEMTDPVLESALDQTPEQREALYENRYQSGGLALYNVYPDVFTDQSANDTLAEFLRRKIAERIKDPELEKKLIPTGYPVLTRRLVAETNYYEVYSQDNVTLHDCREDPIERLTAKGIKTGRESYEFDVIVFATGFDALTGALKRIDIRGRDNVSIKSKFEGESRTVLGMMSAGFPNMFYLNGPGTPSSLFQPILLCDEQVEWIAELFESADRMGRTVIEPTNALEDKWVSHCDDMLNETLFTKANSWYVGANIDGKSPRGLLYFGGIGRYRQALEKCAESNYEGFLFSGEQRVKTTAAKNP